ncbi:MAG: bis(5'-nucleosyl)-tetraphosphatase (symmetrical) YqeK [Anaerolineae bacterium]|nr:bis(5'-nucleosyl)-tetraphosphatase (symmetrical) YqeK [Anaerolineae bacterium]
MIYIDPVLVRYARAVALTGDAATDASSLLVAHGRADTAEHCRRVAAEAVRLARHWGVQEASAAVAGWLHDVSAIVPHADRLRVAEALGLEVLAEERAAPVLIHQKLSAAIARQVLGVVDGAVLSAIGCHTTLKAHSSALDKIVFVADKIAWDQPGDAPYLASIRSAAGRSLDLAAHVYLDYLWQRRDTLSAMHPWAAQAYEELCATVQWEDGGR